MALSREDIAAVQGLAGELKVDPGSLGALFTLEAGEEWDPNRWGGAGGKYRGIIQFGPEARKEVGLPSGPMTIAQQIPYVRKYFQQRGFQPGKHGVTELYRTVLVGNPHQSGTDSFGTNSDKAAQRMMPGGDLYERARKKLGSAGGMAPTPSGGGGGKAPSPQEDALLSGIQGLFKSMVGQGSTSSPTTPGNPFMDVVKQGNPFLAAIPGFGFGAAVAGAAAAGQRSRMAGGQEFFESMQKNLGIGGSLNPAAATGIALATPKSPAQGFMDMMLGALGIGQEPSADGTRMAGGAMNNIKPTGGAVGGKQYSIVDLGKALQGTGLKVGEHIAFGGVGGHSEGSLHYSGKALDVTDWQDPGESERSWKPRKEYLGRRIAEIIGSSGEVFSPHNDPKGHGTHIHIGLPSGTIDEGRKQQIIAARQESLKRFPLRWAG